MRIHQEGIQMMVAAPQVVVQVQLNQVRAVFGEKVWESVCRISKVLNERLDAEKDFTGQITFTVNCKNGGIGGVQAYIQKKI